LNVCRKRNDADGLTVAAVRIGLRANLFNDFIQNLFASCDETEIRAAPR
jgi:hypothetical protein